MSGFSHDGTLLLLDGAAGAPSTVQQVVLFGAIGLIMYLFLFLPQSRDRKAKEALAAGLAKDDKVVLISGVHGRIVSVADLTVEVEVASGVRVTVDKGAVARKGDAPVQGK